MKKEIYFMPRKSGKTTLVISNAYSKSKLGKTVLIICSNKCHYDEIKNRYFDIYKEDIKNNKFISLCCACNLMINCVRSFDYVYVDEFFVFNEDDMRETYDYVNVSNIKNGFAIYSTSNKMYYSHDINLLKYYLNYKHSTINLAKLSEIYDLKLRYTFLCDTDIEIHCDSVDIDNNVLLEKLKIYGKNKDSILTEIFGKYLYKI